MSENYSESSAAVASSVPTAGDIETTTPSTESAREAALLEVLGRYWGYDRFLPLQRSAMLAVLARRDSVVVLPTGGGKSLCFQAPALCSDGMALVVSPLISLMKDQVDTLRSCGVPAAFINSTLSDAERRQVADQIRRRELKLLYVAPERLLAQRTLEFLKTAGVSQIAVDEAHCISAWGHDFRPEYRGLSVLKQAFPGASVHGYSATASEQVRQDIAEQLRMAEPAMLVGSFDRPNLLYRVRRANNRFQQLCEVLERHRGESGVVYCISRKEVDKTAAALSSLGFRAAPYHAGMTDQQRHQNQDDFINDRTDVIVATVAFGMGIDKSNVRFVIHAGMPKSLEHYQQESGRAGRDGLEAECHLLYSTGDYMTWTRMLDGGDAVARDGALRALRGMEDYCNGVGCRHRAIVRYFGQDLADDNCGACDVCLDELSLVEDATTVGQKILSCVLRLEERFGADYTAKVLAGSREQRILQLGHDRLSTYGLLKKEGAGVVRGWIEQLVEQRFLVRAGEYQQLQVTDAGRQLLRREVEPRLLQPSDDGGTTRRSVSADSWEGVDRELFESLRELRGEQATTLQVPAYVVFSDAALRDMARRRPSTLSGFRKVAGVGEKKLEQFGELFLSRIVEQCREREVPMDVEPPPSSANGSDAGGSRGAEVRVSSLPAFELFRQDVSVDEVCRRMNRARSTVCGYLNDFLRHERIIDPSRWVAADLAERIEQSIERVGCEKLRPIFDDLQGEVGYDDIRIVATCYQNRALQSDE